MTRRNKQMLKDVTGVVHLRMFGSRSCFPWCAKYLSLNSRSQRGQMTQLRLVRWVEDDEVVTCWRCILIDGPGLESEFFW